MPAVNLSTGQQLCNPHKIWGRLSKSAPLGASPRRFVLPLAAAQTQHRAPRRGQNGAELLPVARPTQPMLLRQYSSAHRLCCWQTGSPQAQPHHLCMHLHITLPCVQTVEHLNQKKIIKVSNCTAPFLLVQTGQN